MLMHCEVLCFLVLLMLCCCLCEFSSSASTLMLYMLLVDDCRAFFKFSISSFTCNKGPIVYDSVGPSCLKFLFLFLPKKMRH